MFLCLLTFSSLSVAHYCKSLSIFLVDRHKLNDFSIMKIFIDIQKLRKSENHQKIELKFAGDDILEGGSGSILQNWDVSCKMKGIIKCVVSHGKIIIEILKLKKEKIIP